MCLPLCCPTIVVSEELLLTLPFVAVVLERSPQNDSRAYAPFVGISQSARYNSQGEFLLAVNNKVDWFYRGSIPGLMGGQAMDIPLLVRIRAYLFVRSAKHR